MANYNGKSFEVIVCLTEDINYNSKWERGGVCIVKVGSIPRLINLSCIN